jgi:hypothetical protein
MNAGNRGSLPIRSSTGCTAAAAVPITLEEIKARLKALQPGPISAAGETYLAAAKALGDASRRLHRHAEVLTEHWQGEAAEGALQQMGQLNTTTCELASKSHQTGTTAKWLGANEMLNWYKHQGDTIGDGFLHTDGDDERARQVLARLSDRYNEANLAMPENVEKDLPIGDRGDTDVSGLGRQPGGASGIGHGGNGVAGGNLNSRGVHFNSLDGNSPNPMKEAPSSTIGGEGNTDLAGLEHPSLAGIGTGGVDTHGLSGSGLGIAGSSASGFTTSGQGLASPGAGGLGTGGAGEIGAGELINGPSKNGIGRSSSGSTAARYAGNGMPVGSSNQEEGERERSLWLPEDEEIWCGIDDVAPPVIE